ncbi:MAG: hypothetical protein KDC53_00340 [Saprospiraceae bacterium]|nr:hypothetical protein [Saprospiraceae bacterium]
MKGYTQAQTGPDDFRISNQGPPLNFVFEARDPAIAYNSNDSNYLVVWSGVLSASGSFNKKFEIFGRLIDAHGEKIGSDFRISSTLAENDLRLDAENPSVAYNSTDNNFLVVWDAPASFFEITSTAVNDQNEIFGQLLAADGSEIGADFRISDIGPPGQVDFDADDPDISYNPLLNNYLVVWSGDDVRSENEIYGQFISAAGVETGINDFRISDMGPDGNTAFNAFNPSIDYNVHHNNFLIVWQGDDNTGDLVDNEQEIFGQIITADGLETGPNDFRISDMGPDGDINFDAFQPDLVFNSEDTSYLVAWRGIELGDNEEILKQEVYGQIVSGNGQEIGPNDFQISDLLIKNIGIALSKPGLTYDPERNKFQAFYEAIASSDTSVEGLESELEIFGSEISNDGKTVLSPFQISEMGPDGDFAFNARSTGTAYDENNHNSLVIWQGNEMSDELLANEKEIFGQLITQCLDIITSENLSSPLPSGIFQVSETISYQGIIESGGEVIFDAGQMIVLEPGFAVQDGALFMVMTDGCP